VAAGLEAALYVPCPEAAPAARKALKDPKATERVAGTAVLLLGHHGGPEDVAVLEWFRNDARPFGTYLGLDGTSEDVQVRDLAAAMSLHLRGEDFSKYGFGSVGVMAWWAGDAVAPYNSVSFLRPKDRDEAHKKAWAWLDERAKRAKK
jgi:hypothetical protein